MVYLSVANLARGDHTDPPPIHTPILCHPGRNSGGGLGGFSLFLHFPRPPPQSVSFTLSRNLQEWSEEVAQLAFTSDMSIDNIDVLMGIGADSTTTIATDGAAQTNFWPQRPTSGTAFLHGRPHASGLNASVE
jgi:hypothetical protein